MAHIVLDTRIIETSTGRYMQRLLEYINDSYATRDGHTYTALVPGQHVEKWQLRLPNITVLAANQKWYTFAEQWSFYWQLRSLKPDLVHFTMPQQPLLWRGPAVTTIHDVTLIRHDNIAPNENATIYHIKKMVFHALLRVVMRRASAVLAPTEFVRKDLAEFFGQQYLNKIHVTPLAGEIPNEIPEPLADFVDTPYLAVIGNGFPYKNVWRVIDAFSIIKKQHPDMYLLIAGKKDEFYQEMEQKTLTQNIPDVHFLGFISDAEKRWLLQNARAYVTASYSEGFCMPVLEAMIEGAPVLSSNASCLPEVVGEAGLLFNPDSSDELASVAHEVLTDEPLRQALIEKGHKHAASYSWARMVEQAHDIYLQILGSK